MRVPAVPGNGAPAAGGDLLGAMVSTRLKPPDHWLTPDYPGPGVRVGQPARDSTLVVPAAVVPVGVTETTFSSSLASHGLYDSSHSGCDLGMAALQGCAGKGGQRISAAHLAFFEGRGTEMWAGTAASLWLA
jgi:hypothetical protein